MSLIAIILVPPILATLSIFLAVKILTILVLIPCLICLFHVLLLNHVPDLTHLAAALPANRRPAAPCTEEKPSSSSSLGRGDSRPDVSGPVCASHLQWTVCTASVSIACVSRPDRLSGSGSGVGRSGLFISGPPAHSGVLQAPLSPAQIFRLCLSRNSPPISSSSVYSLAFTSLSRTPRPPSYSSGPRFAQFFKIPECVSWISIAVATGLRGRSQPPSPPLSGACAISLGPASAARLTLFSKDLFAISAAAGRRAGPGSLDSLANTHLDFVRGGRRSLQTLRPPRLWMPLVLSPLTGRLTFVRRTIPSGTLRPSNRLARPDLCSLGVPPRNSSFGARLAEGDTFTPRGSKRKRAAARRRVTPSRPDNFLKSKSIGPEAAKRYVKCDAGFRRWAGARRLCLKNDDLLDTALSQYCNALYFDGALPFEGRQALYGVAFMTDRSFRGNAMPKTKRNLAGWDKACKSADRSPIQWEAWCLMAADLLKAGGASDINAAVAGTLSFELYLRPSKALGLSVACVGRPVKKVFAGYDSGVSSSIQGLHDL